MAETGATTRRSTPQLNIRSAYAVERARELAKQSGKTTTQIVEDALRAFSPTQVSRVDQRDRLTRDLDVILSENAKGGPYPSMKEIDDEMYDEWGLPR